MRRGKFIGFRRLIVEVRIHDRFLRRTNGEDIRIMDWHDDFFSTAFHLKRGERRRREREREREGWRRKPLLLFASSDLWKWKGTTVGLIRVAYDGRSRLLWKTPFVSSDQIFAISTPATRFCKNISFYGNKEFVFLSFVISK